MYQIILFIYKDWELLREGEAVVTFTSEQQAETFVRQYERGGEIGRAIKGGNWQIIKVDKVK